MTGTTYIIGHKNPDADSICSALGYEALKKALGHKGYVAARCGNSNARIDAILNRFNTPLPTFVGDVTPRIKDIMRSEIVQVPDSATCAEALHLIDVHDVRALPVIDKDRSITGMISIFDLGEFFIPKAQQLRKMRQVRTSIDYIVESLDAKVLNAVNPESIEDLYLRIGAMDIRSFGRFTQKEGTQPEESIIIVGDRYDIQLKSIQMGVRILVITGNLELDEDVVNMAKEKGVSIIVSPYDSATTSWLVRTATALEPLVERNVITFSPEEKLSAVKRKIADKNTPIFCVVNDENKLVGIFSKTDLIRPIEAQIILVDHNELAQAVNGVSEINIQEIIDHHRLDNPATAKPIYFRNEIIGSTCSIISLMFRENGLKPSPDIAGVLMGGLISDTLNLQSPTSTSRDAEILKWLAEIADVNIQDIAELIFKSGSVIISSTPDEIIQADCKPYSHGEAKFSVSQVEELGYSNFWKHSDEILKALSQYQKNNDYLFSCLLITDINSQSSLLLITGAEEFIQEISYPIIQKNQIFELKGVVSRKKQLIPYLTSLLAQTIA